MGPITFSKLPGFWNYFGTTFWFYWLFFFVATLRSSSDHEFGYRAQKATAGERLGGGVGVGVAVGVAGGVGVGEDDVDRRSAECEANHFVTGCRVCA